MSYEGYTEFLCEKGHHLCVDVFGDDPTQCPICAGRLTHWHSVDETNGAIDGLPDTMPAPVTEIGEERYEAVRKLFAPGPGWTKIA